eukprot:g3138.t1
MAVTATGATTKSLYVAGDEEDTLSWFTPDGAGTIASPEGGSYSHSSQTDGIRHIVMFGDNKVYTTSATDDTVAWWDRDTTTGALTYVGSLASASYYDGASGFVISTDGAFAYVSAPVDNEVSWLTRDTGTGALTRASYSDSITMSTSSSRPGTLVLCCGSANNDAFLYVHCYKSSKIEIYARNPTTGALTYQASIEDDTGGVDGLDGGTDSTTVDGSYATLSTQAMVISPDYSTLYAVGHSEDKLAYFSVDTSTGGLTFGGVLTNINDGTFTDMIGPYSLAISPDGLSLAVASWIDSGVLGTSPAAESGSITWFRITPACTSCGTTTYQNQAGQTSCISCGTGTYQDEQGKSSCKVTSCQTGKYEATANSCVDCTSGQYQDVTGQKTCKGEACATGKYGPLGQTSSGAATCTDCASGQFTSEKAGYYTNTVGKSACAAKSITACVAGEGYSEGAATSDSAACSPCSAGTFNAANDKTACQAKSTTACVTGQGYTEGAATSDSASCSPCSAGFYSSANDNTACQAKTTTACVAGEGYSEASCSPCSAGTYNVANDQTVCQTSSCARGQYHSSATNVAQSCTTCTSGRYTSEVGLTVCAGIECAAGTAGPTGQTSSTAATCANCGDTGQYQELAGQASCKSHTCPAGQFASSAPHEAQACSSACAMGKYRQVAVCIDCPSGTYTSALDQTSCTGTQCTAGNSGPLGQTSSGAASCSPCTAGHYAASGGLGTCTQSTCVQGQYHSSASNSAQACTGCGAGTYTDETGSTSCKAKTTTACPTGQGFSAGSATADDAACSTCAAGQYSTQTAQEACEASTCALGQYHSSAVNQPQACSSCGPGTYTEEAGKASCKGATCTSGKYAAAGQTSAGNAACSNCLSGQYTDEAGKSACKGTVCTAGNSGPAGQTSSAATSCAACSPGRYTTEAGQAACAGTECVAGQAGPAAQTSIGAATCSTCGAGTYTTIGGQATCQASSCALGQYHSSAPSQPQSCTGCGVGTYADETGKGACKAKTVTACPSGQGFAEGPSTSDSAACTPCAGGFFSTTNDKTACQAYVPPSLTGYSSAPAQYRVGTAITASTPTAGGGGAAESFSVTPALPGGLSFATSTGVISGTPAAVRASTSYTVTATNGGGSSTTTLTFAVIDRAPVLTGYATASAVYSQGTAIAVNSPQLGASSGAVVSYSVSPSLPGGLSLAAGSGQISGSPAALQDAATTYTVTATNSGGSATTTLTIRVVPVSPVLSRYATASLVLTRLVPMPTNAPQLGSGGGTPSSFSVAPALPPGLALNAGTGQITGTPTVASAAAASTTHTITATNAGGSSTATITVLVRAAPPSLAGGFTSSTAQYVRGAVIPTNSPSNSGDPATSWTVSPSLPPGLALSPTTGAITGTPSGSFMASPGSYTVTGSNSGGSSSFTLTLQVVDRAPSLQGYTSASVTYDIHGASGSAPGGNTPVLSSTSGAPTSYAIAPSLPAGLYLVASTGAVRGTPTAVTPQTSYTITATNTGGSATTQITVRTVDGTTLVPTLFTVQIGLTLVAGFVLPEAARPGSVQLAFTPSGGAQQGGGAASFTLTLAAGYESAGSHTVSVPATPTISAAGAAAVIASVSPSAQASLVEGATYEVSLQYQDGSSNAVASNSGGPGSAVADFTPPSFSSSPELVATTASTATVRVGASEAVTCHWVAVLQPQGTAASSQQQQQQQQQQEAPSAAQVLAGQQGGGGSGTTGSSTPAPAAGSASISGGATTAAQEIVLEQLPTGQELAIYFSPIDTSGNTASDAEVAASVLVLRTVDDNTPPTTSMSIPPPATETSAELTVSSSEPATVYVMVVRLPQGGGGGGGGGQLPATAPSAELVRGAAGSPTGEADGAFLAANPLVSRDTVTIAGGTTSGGGSGGLTVTGLESGASFAVYSVGLDQAFPPNANAVAAQVVTMPDLTPPAFKAGFPRLTPISETELRIEVALDSPGTVFWVVEQDPSSGRRLNLGPLGPRPGRSRPPGRRLDSQNVAAGRTTSGATPLLQGSLTVASADATIDRVVGGHPRGGGAFTVSVVARDAAGNLQASPLGIRVTLVDDRPPLFVSGFPRFASLSSTRDTVRVEVQVDDGVARRACKAWYICVLDNDNVGSDTTTTTATSATSAAASTAGAAATAPTSLTGLDVKQTVQAQGRASASLGVPSVYRYGRLDLASIAAGARTASPAPSSDPEIGVIEIDGLAGDRSVLVFVATEDPRGNLEVQSLRYTVDLVTRPPKLLQPPPGQVYGPAGIPVRIELLEPARPGSVVLIFRPIATAATATTTTNPGTNPGTNTAAAAASDPAGQAAGAIILVQFGPSFETAGVHSTTLAPDRLGMTPVLTSITTTTGRVVNTYLPQNSSDVISVTTSHTLGGGSSNNVTSTAAALANYAVLEETLQLQMTEPGSVFWRAAAYVAPVPSPLEVLQGNGGVAAGVVDITASSSSSSQQPGEETQPVMYVAEVRLPLNTPTGVALRNDFALIDTIGNLNEQVMSLPPVTCSVGDLRAALANNGIPASEAAAVCDDAGADAFGADAARATVVGGTGCGFARPGHDCQNATCGFDGAWGDGQCFELPPEPSNAIAGGNLVALGGAMPQTTNLSAAEPILSPEVTAVLSSTTTAVVGVGVGTAMASGVLAVAGGTGGVSGGIAGATGSSMSSFGAGGGAGGAGGGGGGGGMALPLILAMQGLAITTRLDPIRAMGEKSTYGTIFGALDWTNLHVDFPLRSIDLFAPDDVAVYMGNGTANSSSPSQGPATGPQTIYRLTCGGGVQNAALVVTRLPVAGGAPCPFEAQRPTRDCAPEKCVFTETQIASAEQFCVDVSELESKESLKQKAITLFVNNMLWVTGGVVIIVTIHMIVVVLLQRCLRHQNKLYQRRLSMHPASSPRMAFAKESKAADGPPAAKKPARLTRRKSVSHKI